MIEYFTQSPPFGPISWTMLVVWAAALALGVYLLRSYRDNNAVRLRFAQRVGQILSALSGVGILLLILKLFGVPVLEWRLWSYIVALASVIYWGYALYQYNTVLPAQAAAVRPARVVRGQSPRSGAKVYTTSGDTVPRPPREPRPIATTTRREARRDKKRKSR